MPTIDAGPMLDAPRVAAMRHGDGGPHGEPGDLPASRFGKLFPHAEVCSASSGALERLAALLATRRAGSHQIHGFPSGFTYLGQFIDHDITFDPVSELGRPGDPQRLANFRTPRFDLDSVYGLGPAVQPFLYDWDARPKGVKLLIGRRGAGPRDLPRNQGGIALIGDPRNDENVITAQLHLLFLRFHNAVVGRFRAAGRDRDAVFEEAQRSVRWHYQWIVVHEFLRKVVGEEIAGRVLDEPAGGPASARLEHYEWSGTPFIPVEFSGAAYRFGHSLVRAGYRLKKSDGAELPLFPKLDGGRWLTAQLEIDWERFFRLGSMEPQRALGIDTHIAAPLLEVPRHAPGSLPLRNLLRGITLQLPSGQAVADALRLPRLDEADLLLAELGDDPARAELTASTPLWYYVLCEAQQQRDGKTLGELGGTIVAEVLVGLLAADPRSYLSVDPAWRPTLGKDRDGRPDFTMADLIRIAQGSA
jgi:Animal haem peroxidase